MVCWSDGQYGNWNNSDSLLVSVGSVGLMVWWSDGSVGLQTNRNQQKCTCRGMARKMQVFQENKHLFYKMYLAVQCQLLFHFSFTFLCLTSLFGSAIFSHRLFLNSSSSHQPRCPDSSLWDGCVTSLKIWHYQKKFMMNVNVDDRNLFGFILKLAGVSDVVREMNGTILSLVCIRCFSVFSEQIANRHTGCFVFIISKE